jgi:hypothetical protein
MRRAVAISSSSTRGVLKVSAATGKGVPSDARKARTALSTPPERRITVSGRFRKKFLTKSALSIDITLSSCVLLYSRSNNITISAPGMEAKDCFDKEKESFFANLPVFVKFYVFSIWQILSHQFETLRVMIYNK